MPEQRERRWCVAKRRVHPTGPDKIHYGPTFKSRGEAEEEKNRLAELPENIDEWRFSVALEPREDRPKLPLKNARPRGTRRR